MDTSKLRFDIDITYDCDEGEGCDATLEDGTYEQAKHLLEDLEQSTWITGYYHYMSINYFDVYDENGEQLDFSAILDGDYEWIGDSYSTNDKNEATEIPKDLLKFLKDLKNGGKGKKTREVKELKARIKKLKKELKEAEEKLAKLEKKSDSKKEKKSDSKKEPKINGMTIPEYIKTIEQAYEASKNSKLVFK